MNKTPSIDSLSVFRPSTLKDLAIKKCSEMYRKPTIYGSGLCERTILFVGSKGVGKTSLIHRFLDKVEVPKPTLALDYTYGRKAGKTYMKEVCHIWELGGGTIFVPLLDALISSMGHGNMQQLTVILMLDMSAPHHLWYTLETVLNSLYSSIQNYTGSSFRSLVDEKTSGLVVDSTNRNFLFPFPVSLVIFGGKYDIFQEFDPETKKAVCCSLRCIAITLGAALQFYSIKESGLVRKAKDVLNHHGFGSAPIKVLSQDYNKPLIIPAGSDSFQQMGSLLSVVTTNRKGPPSDIHAALEPWKHIFTSQFSQEASERNAMPEDPGKDVNYIEPFVDDLRAEKDNELEVYRQIAERKKELYQNMDLDM